MKFSIDMIDRSPVLSDRFLYPNFNQINGDLLKKCYTRETLKLVSQHIKQKKTASTRQVCSDLSADL